jgi:hypothetical protein
MEVLMDMQANSTTTTTQETIVVNPTLRERFVKTMKKVERASTKACVVAGLALAGVVCGAYYLYEKSHGSVTPEE